MAHAASTYSTPSHPSPNHPKHAPTHTHDTAALRCCSWAAVCTPPLQLAHNPHTATVNARPHTARASRSAGRTAGRDHQPIWMAWLPPRRLRPLPPAHSCCARRRCTLRIHPSTAAAAPPLNIPPRVARASPACPRVTAATKTRATSNGGTVRCSSTKQPRSGRRHVDSRKGPEQEPNSERTTAWRQNLLQPPHTTAPVEATRSMHW